MYASHPPIVAEFWKGGKKGKTNKKFSLLVIRTTLYFYYLYYIITSSGASPCTTENSDNRKGSLVDIYCQFHFCILSALRSLS